MPVASSIICLIQVLPEPGKLIKAVTSFDLLAALNLILGLQILFKGTASFLLFWPHLLTVVLRNIKYIIHERKSLELFINFELTN